MSVPDIESSGTPLPVGVDVTPTARLPLSALSGMETISGLDQLAADAAKVATGRLKALDAFRGLTIVLMLLVNNIALDRATPAQFLHAPWNGGVRVADLVMPWFLLAVGVAIPFAASSAQRHGMAPWRYDVKILLRAGLLIALGVLLDSSGRHTLVFTLGVLQMIGLAYLVAAFFYDLPLGRRVMLLAGMLVSYWAAIRFIPVPGVGAGVFTEGHNFIHYLNATFFNRGYGVGLKGLPSIVPTAALVMIGSVIGDVLRRRKWSEIKRLSALWIIGLTLTGAGWWWNLDLPFNKAVWTPSYVLFTAGLGILLLGTFYLLLDAAGWWWWAYPLLVFGANAMLAYILPILVKTLVLHHWLINHGGQFIPVDQWLLASLRGHFGLISGGWLYTSGYILLWWVVLWQFYRRKTFIRV